MRPKKKKKKQRNAPIRLGVDFGTTHTLVALADEGNYPVISLPFDYEGEVLAEEQAPTCVTIHKGKLYYGSAAINYFLDRFDEGAFLIPSIKRLLQDWHEGMAITIEDTQYPVEELIIGFLSEIRRAILRALDLKKVDLEAVIAVPANASSSQRYVTLNSFRQAGFKVIRILDEPCASGIQFVRERYKRWDRVKADVIIYDLGGGTFDTTLLSIRQGEYDPVLSRGISRLGGDDFDEILLQLVEETLKTKFTGRLRVEMLHVARAVKEGISPYTKMLHVDTPHGTASIPIKTYQEAIQPLMEKTIDLVEDVLVETKGQDEPADRIVLVGGATLLSAVPKLLRERFGRAKIHQGLYPFASVAIGAAIQAGSPEIRVQDRLNNHFGVIRVREDGTEYVDVIFEKGLKLPKNTDVFQVTRPVYDPRYNIGRFLYLECNDVDHETGRAKGDPVFWNEILFPYDRTINSEGQAPANLSTTDISETDHLRHERILEEYFLDPHGIVTTRISRTVQDHFSGCYNLFRNG